MAGINIDSDDASKENIPEDLNSLAYSAYRIPNIIRRRLITYLTYYGDYQNLILIEV